MLKLVIIGRRAPGNTRRAAQNHLRTVHGRLVVQPPADSGPMPLRYVQNHVIDGAYSSGQGTLGIERDLVTELWFDDFDHLRASTATPYYLANLKPDEPKFVDDRLVEKLVVRPELMVEGERGIYKVFFGVASFANVDQLEEAITNAKGMGGAVRNVVLPPPDGSKPFVSLIFEVWFEMLDNAHALVDGIASAMANDAMPKFAIIAEQYDAERLTGIY